MADTVTLERDDWHTIAAALLTIDHYTGGHDGIHLVAKISVQIDPPPEGPLP